MLRNRIYYGLKPLIPRTIRMKVRRSIALRTRKRATGVWPIMPGLRAATPTLARLARWQEIRFRPHTRRGNYGWFGEVQGFDAARHGPWVSLLIQFCSRRRVPGSPPATRGPDAKWL